MNNSEVIAKNAEGDETTFMGVLHEDHRFDVDLFWELYDALNTSNEELKNQNKVSKALVKHVLKMQRVVLSSIIHHFDPDDDFHIGNLSDIPHHGYLERLNCIVDCFGERLLKESSFDDDLR